MPRQTPRLRMSAGVTFREDASWLSGWINKSATSPRSPRSCRFDRHVYAGGARQALRTSVGVAAVGYPRDYSTGTPRRGWITAVIPPKVSEYRAKREENAARATYEFQPVVSHTWSPRRSRSQLLNDSLTHHAYCSLIHDLRASDDVEHTSLQCAVLTTSAVRNEPQWSATIASDASGGGNTSATSHVCMHMRMAFLMRSPSTSYEWATARFRHHWLPALVRSVRASWRGGLSRDCAVNVSFKRCLNSIYVLSKWMVSLSLSGT